MRQQDHRRAIVPLQIGPWLGVTLWIGTLLNAPTAWSRTSGFWANAPAFWTVAGPVAEWALVTGTLGLILLSAQVVGPLLFRSISIAALLISAACAYYMARFGVVIGHGVLNAVLTADHAMSGEIVGMWSIVSFLMLGLVPAVIVWRRPTGLGLWSGWRNRAWRIKAVVMLLISATLLSGGNMALKKARKALKEPGGPEINLVGVAAHTYLPSNWISALGMVVAGRVRQARDDARLIIPAKQHQYRTTTPLSDALVILVIGETTRSDHLGLLGYRRDTTPHLSAAKGVAAFAGWSCDTSTKLSLACMFVRPSAVVATGPGQPDRIIEDNVFSVYRSLGFRIDLLAMQSEEGFYSRVRPDSIKFREMIVADPANAGMRLDDRLLLPEVDRFLATQQTGSRPQLLVLHTKGSHAMYSQRYPREFARWTPECMSSDDVCSVDELTNAFDNSVLFIDQMLHDLRRMVEQRKAMMIFVPDHGESISENSHFHATPRHIAPPEQRRVPLVFWASDSWLAQPVLGERFARLQARAQGARALPTDDPTYGHHNLFASMLGCIGVEGENASALPTSVDLCR